MTQDERAVTVLADLLAGGSAMADVEQERIAPSTIYDVHYRVMVNAFAFVRLSQSSDRGRVLSAKLNLTQFVAIRPWLVSVVRSWSHAHHDPQMSMDISQRLRRGFLGDTMQESVVELLTAAGVFVRMAGHLARGQNSTLLDDWIATVAERGLFNAERTAIEEVASIRITTAMLEGW